MQIVDDRLFKNDLATFLRFGFVPREKPFLNPGEGCFESYAELVRNEILSSTQYPFFKYASKSGSSKGFRQYNFEEFDSAWLHALRNSGLQDEHIGVLLSGGKDSTAIVYGLRRIGVKNVTCFTYVPAHGENEAEDAASVCEALGFEHVTLRHNSKADFQAWVSILARSEKPCGDFAFPAVCRIFQEMKSRGISTAVDGIGNDVYMGFTTSKTDHLFSAFNLTRLFGRSVWGKDWLFSLIGPWQLKYIASSLLMHPLERMFSGSRLGVDECRNLGIPISPIWDTLTELADSTDGMPDYQKRAYCRGLLFDQFGAMRKSIIAGESAGIKVSFPFINEHFCEYYCSLEESERFDLKRGINKVALRKYLTDLRSQYGIAAETYNSKKGSFRFNFSDFIGENKEELRKAIDFRNDKTFVHDLQVFAIALLNKKRDYYRDSKLFLVLSFLIWESKRSNI